MRKKLWGLTEYFDLPGSRASLVCRLVDKPSRRVPSCKSYKLLVPAISARHRLMRFSNGSDLDGSWQLKVKICANRQDCGQWQIGQSPLKAVFVWHPRSLRSTGIR